MRVKVTTEAKILVDDKVVTDEQVALDIEQLARAREDVKKIRKLLKERDIILRDYNTHGKDTSVVTDTNEKTIPD